MENGSLRILVIGYGNPGRLDDGLGPALADALEQMALPGVTVESDYQLTVEDAAAVAAHDVVIFADAACDGREPFTFRRLAAVDGERIDDVPGPRFTSHHLAPADVLELARRLFRGRPEGYLLAIRGYDFNEFGEGLSVGARANLERAVEFLAAAIELKVAEGAGGSKLESTSTHGELKCRTASM